MGEVREFRIDTPQAQLDDLRQRLRMTRWPDAQTASGWEQGLPLDYARELHTYWLNAYDFRSREAYYNRFPQFKTELDGLDIHFIHAKSPHGRAKPLLMTHGWPGSVVEFHKVIEPLRNPTDHGGTEADAFHVVCPSLPGFGFSGKPRETGWGVEKIAKAWDALMCRLGYPRYYAQGGDWGAGVATAIGIQNLGHCAGLHVNMPNAMPTEQSLRNPDERDKQALAAIQHYRQKDNGYAKLQSTRPQTLGYALADSPMGQAAWIIEKFREWSDCDGHPETVYTRDELLDNAMFYWLTGSGASSARLYWESFGLADNDPVVIPAGGSIFPKEIVPTPRSWAEQRYTNLVYWNELERGGHFAAFERPQVFVSELRACFAQM